MSLAMVIQGYFPHGIPRQMISQRPAAIQPRMAKAATRRPPTYQELTVQAHLRSSSGALGPVVANGTAFVLPSHLASFDRRPGQRLPASIQQKMGAFFNTDFSGVQVHIGPEASSIGALAFTQGSDIFFAPGQYDLASHEGQQLLAHELTHVVQQRAGRVRNPFGSGVAVVQDPALEAEAERMGNRAAMKSIADTRSSLLPKRRIGSKSRQSIQRSSISTGTAKRAFGQDFYAKHIRDASKFVGDDDMIQQAWAIFAKRASSSSTEKNTVVFMTSYQQQLFLEQAHNDSAKGSGYESTTQFPAVDVALDGTATLYSAAKFDYGLDSDGFTINHMYGVTSGTVSKTEKPKPTHKTFD